MKQTENILIDCTSVGKDWELSSSLIGYTTRLVQGFLQYGNYKPHLLVWSEMRNFFDKLIGHKVDKIVLNHDDLITSWRPYYRLFNVLPRRLEQEMAYRRITTILLPFHHRGLFYFRYPYQHYAIVHDMFFYDNTREERGRVSFFFWRMYRRMLTRKFSHMITISRMTHDELLRLDGVESEIVYNSFPFDFSINMKSVKDVSGLKYILDVNRFQHYKNAEVLVLALNLLRNEIPHKLYLKGDKSSIKGREELINLVSKLGLEDRVIFDMEYRTEGEMRYLYSHADLFVSPSLKEGFGWTPIEAAILKTPVLVSDIEVFREVLCGKLTTFDPHSPEDLARHILDMLNNPPSEEERVQLSEFFLERYSLKNQIEQFTKIFERDRKSSR